jgi:hypothetical protein
LVGEIKEGALNDRVIPCCGVTGNGGCRSLGIVGGTSDPENGGNVFFGVTLTPFICSMMMTLEGGVMKPLVDPALAEPPFVMLILLMMEFGFFGADGMFVRRLWPASAIANGFASLSKSEVCVGERDDNLVLPSS